MFRKVFKKHQKNLKSGVCSLVLVSQVLDTGKDINMYNYIILYYIKLYYIILSYIILYFIISYYIILYCIILYFLHTKI